MKFQVGNIYSGTKGGLAVLTNPTALAKKKGNLQHDYPVTIDGKTYIDGEAAYQALAASCKADTKRCYEICVSVCEAKLRQHKKVLDAITMSGGVDFLRQCSHWVGWRKENPGRWEGQGIFSGYIRCLIRAYKNALLNV